MRRRVVITGLGAVTPLGNNLQKTWQGVLEGHSGVGGVTLFDASTFPVRIAAEVKGFSFDLSVLPENLRKFAGRSTQLCLSASEMAIQDSGLNLDMEDPGKIGVSLGADEEYVALGLFESLYNKDYVLKAVAEGEDAFVELLQHSSPLSRIWSLRRKTDTGARLLSYLYNFQGSVSASHTSCASSGHAIGKAKRLIEYGDCDIVVTGGHCSMVCEFSVGGFHMLGTLSCCNDAPEHASRPFDRNRDGFVIGEGSGILMLEEMEHARKRGARIYAELLGFGSSSNAYRITDSPPDGRGGSLAMERCLEDAQINTDKIDYINAHGTGTQLNDSSETLSIKNVFGRRAFDIPVSSSKSMMGHLVCSSSAVELIITAMAVKENIVPPTINLETPDPKCDLHYVPNHSIEQKVDVAISNSFAFGGQNATLAVGKFYG